MVGFPRCWSALSDASTPAARRDTLQSCRPLAVANTMVSCQPRRTGTAHRLEQWDAGPPVNALMSGAVRVRHELTVGEIGSGYWCR